MPADDTPSDGIPSHRPLPSVDIPLLRDERRAVRARQVFGTVAIAVAIGGGVAAAVVIPRYFARHSTSAANPGGPAVPRDLGMQSPAAPELPSSPGQHLTKRGHDGGRPHAPDAGMPPAAPPPTPVGPVEARTTHAFGNAGSFHDALVGAGASRDEAQELITALESVVDFRRCQPDDTLTFERDAHGVLVRFQYKSGLTQIFEATRDAHGRLHGRRVEVPIERARIARGGHISSSLGDALDALGLGRVLVGAFVEVFEGRIRFTSATRGGDSFRIIVDEERVNGQFLRYGTIHALEYVGSNTGTHRAFWSESAPGLGDFFDPTGRAMHGGWLRTPLRYEQLSSGFDPRRMHPVLHRIMPHNGVDYAAAPGTPVWAAADGTVTFAGDRGPNGNLVSLRHVSGYESFYAHLSRFATGLAAGAQVRQRQVIGYVGTTGRSTGPHLHFGLKRRGRFIDPMRELNGIGRMLPAAELGPFRQRAARLTAELERIALAPAPPPSSAPSPPPTGTEDFHDDEGDSAPAAPPRRPSPRAPAPRPR